MLWSLQLRAVQLIVPVWHPTGSAPPPGGVFPDPSEYGADVSLALPKGCAMRNQEPAPSGPWSGSACWTQVSEPVLHRVSPVCPWIPGPAKRKLDFRELGWNFGPRVHPFPIIPCCTPPHDALVKTFMDLKVTTVGKVDLGASSEAEGWKDVLQLLREQDEKMERLAIALSIIQQGMLRNNPRHVP